MARALRVSWRSITSAALWYDRAVLARWPALWESAGHWLIPGAAVFVALLCGEVSSNVGKWIEHVGNGLFVLSAVLHVTRRSPYETDRGIGVHRSYFGLLSVAVALTIVDVVNMNVRGEQISCRSIAVFPALATSANAARSVRLSTLISVFLVIFLIAIRQSLDDESSMDRHQTDVCYALFSGGLLAVSTWLVLVHRSHRAYALGALGIFLCGGGMLVASPDCRATVMYFMASFVFRAILQRAATLPARSR